MMDISDGVSSEILHLCRQSNLGCNVFEDKLPIHEAARKAAFKDTTAAADPEKPLHSFVIVHTMGADINEVMERLPPNFINSLTD